PSLAFDIPSMLKRCQWNRARQSVGFTSKTTLLLGELAGDRCYRRRLSGKASVAPLVNIGFQGFWGNNVAYDSGGSSAFVQEKETTNMRNVLLSVAVAASLTIFAMGSTQDHQAAPRHEMINMSMMQNCPMKVAHADL